MQSNHDGPNGEAEWLERRNDVIAEEYRRNVARIEQIRRERTAADTMTWQERRAYMRQKTAEITKRALAVVGILWLVRWARDHPQQAVAGVAFTAVATLGSLTLIPESPDFSVAPDGPPQAIVVTPTKPPDGRKFTGPLPPGELPTEPPSELEVAPGTPSGVGPSAPGESGPGPTSGPTVAPTPSPSATPEATPTATRPPPTPTATPEPPEPTATSPPPTPPPSPSPTPTPTPSPSPTPTATPTTTPPDIPPQCLLFVDIPALLEVCLLDLSQGGSGQLLDGAAGRQRILYG